jgi:hypothetical protein
MSEPASGPDLVAAFLADHDVPCPRCGYNLRGLNASACPECSLKLNLGIHPAHGDGRVVRWALITLIAFGGVCAYSLLSWMFRLIVWYYGPSWPPMTYWAHSLPQLLTSVVFSVLVIGTLVSYRRLARGDRARAGAWLGLAALRIWAMSLAVYIATEVGAAFL